ncbi:class B sortase [Oscillibacter sp. PC13]|uniref:class B sortase n=1 Tax=Oscillibacter sp. PC13 TaxID=1855299 RepID=UPI00116071B5|nr:class B sortase [Oscillibacter sp. PC13]
MRGKLRMAAMILLGLVFAGSIGMLLYRNAEYKEGEEAYAEAETLVQLPDLTDLPAPVVETESPENGTEQAVYVDPYADALRNMDFTALREVNSDVLGWITIPGTAVSYPLLQGTDNQYYLKHTWKKWSSAVGAIFLECQNSRDMSDFNTVVYGHRMNNGSMFASLKYYKKQSYWSAHPYVYITNDYGSHRYEIFAAYEVSTAGKTYQIGFSGDETKQVFLGYCMEQSVIDTGITPTVHDKILTLSTCTGNGHSTRWVVQAMLKGGAPSDAAEEAEQSGEDGTTPAVEPAQAPAAAAEEIPASGEESAQKDNVPADEEEPVENEAEEGGEMESAPSAENGDASSADEETNTD